MKKIKKAFAAILIGTMCVSLLAGCGKKKEVLRVGMEIGYPPFEYYDTDGSTPVGVDVELGKAIAEEMGVEVEFINTAWDGIFAGLEKGDFDCIISAVTITPDRLLNFDFSTPYIENYQCIVTLKDSAVKPASPDELAGLKIGYQEETTSDIFITDYAEANNIETDPYEYAKVMDCYTDLELGRLDAVVSDSTVAQGYISSPDSIYEMTWIQDDGTEAEQFGVCIKKGNTELLDKVNAALETLKTNGKIDEIISNNF